MGPLDSYPSELQSMVRPYLGQQEAQPRSQSSLFPEFHKPTFSDWTIEDKARQGLYYGLLGADWAQTEKYSRDPQRYHETNPLITHFTGPHPSRGQINNIVAGTALGHLLLMTTLPSEWRKFIQELSILGEGAVVLTNP